MLATAASERFSSDGGLRCQENFAAQTCKLGSPRQRTVQRSSTIIYSALLLQPLRLQRLIRCNLDRLRCKFRCARSSFHCPAASPFQFASHSHSCWPLTQPLLLHRLFSSYDTISCFLPFLLASSLYYLVARHRFFFSHSARLLNRSRHLLYSPPYRNRSDSHPLITTDD